MSILGKIGKNLWGRLWGREEGQALVETSLVLWFVLIPMVLGAADLAQVAYTAIAVENAAKAGAQYGCQNGYTAQDSTGIQTAASDEATGLTVVATPTSACACSDGTASTCLNTDCGNSHIEQTLTVKTVATVTPLIHLPLIPSSYIVQGKAIERVAQ